MTFRCCYASLEHFVLAAQLGCAFVEGLRADAPVREAATGRRELPPAIATAPATLAHALEVAAAFNMAAVWWLCPLAGTDS